MLQISNKIYCDEFLSQLDIKTKILPNPYHDYPFIIIKNFLSTDICKEISQTMKSNQDVVDAKIRKSNNLKIKADTNTNIRKTKIHILNDLHQNIYNENFLKHKKEIEHFFNMAITTSTKIQALEYTKGSFYKEHCDDSSMLVKNNKVVGFSPVAKHRKISSILFATSHSDIRSKDTFNGGELLFNYLYDDKGNNVKIKPNAGDMLVFLSNPYFTHEVLKVNEGYRVSLVQWHDTIFN